VSAVRKPFEGPDRERALADYARLAPGYDASCKRILALREAAIAALALRPGETVFDVACGTGAALPALAAAVAPSGRVIGIEQCPQMASRAAARVAPLACCSVVEASVENLAIEARADAMLFCYTHDVLQSARALERLRAHARPGCRVAVLGIRLLPWPWGFALNAFTLARAHTYFTSFRGLQAPWALLERNCPGLRPSRHFHLGTSYLAVGRY
jgi:SAM-dependent methyltransferase